MKHIRSVALGGLCLLALPGVAAAADLAIRPQITKAPAATAWDGWYVGAHGGYAFGDQVLDFAGVFAVGTEPKGGFGGLQIGYLQHLNRNWVVGFEIDSSFGSVNGDAFGGFVNFDVNYFGSARARLGYASGPWLVYGTAGTAWATTTFSVPLGFSAKYPYVGYTVGAGVEYALSRNWSARVEYLYADLGETVFTIGGFAIASDLQMSTVRLAVNYRFADVPAAAAHALPVKAPVYARNNWSGMYVGVHGGHANGSQEFAILGFGLELGSRGFLGGIQSGVNWQLSRNLVVGIEADNSWASLDGNLLGFINHETKSLGSARLRLGYADNNVLFYGTGGLAWAQAELSVPLGLLSFERYFFGWAAGVGVEYALSPRWSAKLEYIHYAFNDNEIALGPFVLEDRLSQDVVRLGINYRASLLGMLFNN